MRSPKPASYVKQALEPRLEQDCRVPGQGLTLYEFTEG